MSLTLPDDIRRILEAGNAAPSGENCQPWHFFVRGKCIEIHLLPERDKSAYSWGQRASYLANGAAIENMSIAASAEHYRVSVTYFPDPNDVWHVATLTLTADATVQPDALVESIGTRVSNRKAYSHEALSARERKQLHAAVATGKGTFSLVEDRASVQTLGRVGSTNEEVMLGNRALHNFFFSHVNWTKEEDEEKKVGFYIKTLELPPPAEMAFRVFRHWSIMRVLSALGFSRIIAKQNAATNAEAAAIGALLLEGTEPLDFVMAGHSVERLWLTATSLGLWAQPLVGTLLFHLKIVGGERGAFSEHEERCITKAYAEASQILHAGNNYIAFMLRIGRGTSPSARAVRFPLQDVVTVIS